MNIILRKFHFPIKVVFVFLCLMVFVYGRGINFNIQDAETQIKNVANSSSSKAFFLTASLTTLVILNGKKLIFTHVANFKLWVTYFAILLISILFRSDIIGGIYNLLTIVVSYLILFQLLTYVYKIPYPVLRNLFIYFSFSVSLLAVVFHIEQGNRLVFFPDRSVDNTQRLGGIFYYAHTAIIIGTTLLFSCVAFLETRKKRFIVICVLSGILLIPTDCRSVWFGCLGSLFFIAFPKQKFYKIFTFLILGYIVGMNYGTILGMNSTISTAENDTDYRIQIWSYSLKLLSNNYWGYGRVNPFLSATNALSDRLQDPHNSLISLALQSGVIAALFYLFVYIKNLMTSISGSNNVRFLFFYWVFIPFFWGNIYNHLSSFISFYMLFSLYAFALNPYYLFARNRPVVINANS